MPVGIINIYHEPPSFNGVDRPEVDTYVIPTTWREPGVGLFGALAEGLRAHFTVTADDARGHGASTGPHHTAGYSPDRLVDDLRTLSLAESGALALHREPIDLASIARDVARMLVILPFEEEFYAQHGVKATYVGNPLADEQHDEAALPLDPARPVLALLPGSRLQEIHRLWPPMLAAARELPYRRLIVVFQPHRYSRYLALRDEFAESFDGADAVLISEIYPAGEENPGGVSAAELAMRVRGARFAPDLGTLRAKLDELVGDGDLLLLMGAGDIWKLGDELAHGR